MKRLSNKQSLALLSLLSFSTITFMASNELSAIGQNKPHYEVYRTVAGEPEAVEAEDTSDSKEKEEKTEESEEKIELSEKECREKKKSLLEELKEASSSIRKITRNILDSDETLKASYVQTTTTQDFMTRMGAFMASQMMHSFSPISSIYGNAFGLASGSMGLDFMGTDFSLSRYMPRPSITNNHYGNIYNSYSMLGDNQFALGDYNHDRSLNYYNGRIPSSHLGSQSGIDNFTGFDFRVPQVHRTILDSPGTAL